MKRVNIEPGWQVHSYYESFVVDPPEDYEFTLGASSPGRWMPGDGQLTVGRGSGQLFRSTNRWLKASVSDTTKALIEDGALLGFRQLDMGTPV